MQRLNIFSAENQQKNQEKCKGEKNSIENCPKTAVGTLPGRSVPTLFPQSPELESPGDGWEHFRTEMFGLLRIIHFVPLLRLLDYIELCIHAYIHV